MDYKHFIPALPAFCGMVDSMIISFTCIHFELFATSILDAEHKLAHSQPENSFMKLFDVFLHDQFTSHDL